MGLFDIFKKKDEPSALVPEVIQEPKVKKPRAPRKPKVVPVITPVALTAKEIATEKNEPYITVVGIEVDPDNIGNGAFELDWNDKFIVSLVRAGYVGRDDQQIVDQWFQEICKNVVSEAFEQEQSDPIQRQSTRRRLDPDRTEFS
jgi:hypothetical protein